MAEHERGFSFVFGEIHQGLNRVGIEHPI
jgi:hypothetical protein